ncbi:MAG TPA: PDZ domain-containing protein [Polyangiaceae bacterium]|nr:PDZ domain-containing protein [Polyangiaceae bacterium]
MNRSQLQRIASTLGGIAVWTTCEGSLARAAGLRYGDVILSVNGQPTPSIRAYFRAKSLCSEGMTLTYFRAGRTHAISIPLPRAAAAPSVESSLNEFVSSRAVALVDALSKRQAN